jgi:hypothetical protein
MFVLLFLAPLSSVAGQQPWDVTVYKDGFQFQAVPGHDDCKNVAQTVVSMLHT